MRPAERISAGRICLYMKEQYLYREATVADVQSIMQLVQQRIDWMNEMGLHQWNETDYFGRYPRSYWEDNIGFFLVAEVGGQVVAAMALYHEDIRWTRDGELYGAPLGDSPAFYLHHLVTDPRCKGVGRRLMEYTESYAMEHGVKILRLDSAIGNQTLERYYTSQGYMERGRCHDRLYHGVLREKILS
jgi:GNAT superfamily N-acetyltransferase